MPADWSRAEVEATAADYLAMLAAELSAVPYNKAEHRRRLQPLLNDRSEQSIEFKHANISAVLIELGFPYISGYKPRSNYQQLLFEVVAERLSGSQQLLQLAAADTDLPIVVPEVDDILAIVTAPPTASKKYRASEPAPFRPKRCAMRDVPSVGVNISRHSSMTAYCRRANLSEVTRQPIRSHSARPLRARDRPL